MTAVEIARLEALLEKATPSVSEQYPHLNLSPNAMHNAAWGLRRIALQLEADNATIKNAMPELLKAARDGESERLQIKAAVNRLNALANYGRISRLLKGEVIGIADSLTPLAVDRINAAMKEASRV